jgi:hypothetical protein
MWSNFTINNYSKLKNTKFTLVDLNSLYYIEKQKILEKLKNINFPEYQISPYKIPLNKINKLISSKWVDSKVLNNLENLDAEYIIKWNKNKIIIKCTTKKFNNIKKRLHYLLKVIDFINIANINITIYLILTKLKKQINFNINKIDAEHINSGYTDIHNKLIFIWREEEFEKVIFHELIHLLDLDHRHEIYSEYNEFESLYETITDVKGISYNLIYLASITNHKLHKLISYEFSFIHNQAIMINNLINKNIKLISPAFSYFVLKSMFLNYILSDNFLLDEYNNIFIYNKNFNNIIKKLKMTFSNNYINYNSARMTFFELE